MIIKFIKILCNINFYLFVINIILMVTVYLGFLFEILLGSIQVLSSLLLLIIWGEISNNNKKQILKYWFIVFVYFSLWVFNWDFLNDWVLYIVGIGFIPLCIAWYFIKVLEEIKKEIIYEEV